MLQKLQLIVLRFALVSIGLGALVVYGSYIISITADIKTPKALVDAQAEAEYHSALAYATGEGVEQNMHKAFELFALSAEHGFSEAQFILGSAYYQGIPAQNYNQDYSKAYIWFSRAANNGFARAPALRYEVAAFLSPAELMAARQEMERHE